MIGQHPNLFDAIEAEAARDRGIALVRGKDRRLSLALERAIRLAAYEYQEFTSDTTWGFLGGQEQLWVKDSPNAMGAAFRTAAMAGLIESTGRVEKSARVAAHRRNLVVWRILRPVSDWSLTNEA